MARLERGAYAQEKSQGADADPLRMGLVELLMQEPIAYLNDTFVLISRAQLHVFDMGVVGGVSVSEMARTFRHSPFQLDRHLNRFQMSLDATGIEVGSSKEQLRDICLQVVAANSKLIPSHHDLGLIVFATAGQNLTYVGRAGGAAQCAPTLCVHTFPLPFELWGATYEAGLHLVTVKTRSIPGDVIDPRIKHRSRLHWHLAAREARVIDPAAMALLTDADGNLTETATGNLCVVDGSTVITPARGVLEGVSREYLAGLAESMGIEFVHAAVTVDDLAHSDEAFLTSTPHCLLPVTWFNGAAIGAGTPGPMYRQFVEAWSQAVGVDIVAQMSRGAIDRMNS